MDPPFFFVMKCFIDPVCKKLHFITILNGFLRQKKKKKLTDFDSLFVPVASLSGSALSRGTGTGQRSPGTGFKEPSWMTL